MIASFSKMAFNQMFFFRNDTQILANAQIWIAFRIQDSIL